MSLLDQAQRRVNQERVSNRIAENRREQQEAEFARAFAYLDSQEAVVGSGLEKLSYMEIQNLRAELTRMHQESLGDPYDGEVPEGGPDTVIFRKSS